MIKVFQNNYFHHLWQGLKPYIQLMRLDKPIGIYLLLWPTLWALWVAQKGIPPFSILIVFILGVILMRSAGCIINDIADRHFDKHVTRTKNRPLAQESLSLKQALLLFFILILAAFSLLFFVNSLTRWLASIGLALAIIYPFTKRFIHMPQLILGMSFAWAVPMAFAALQDQLPVICALLYLATIIWALSYDTIYAMIDRDEDKKIGIKSLAILVENYDRSFIAGVHIFLITLLGIVGFTLSLGSMYFVCLTIGAIFLIHLQNLIHDNNKENYFKAFKKSHWFGAIIWLGFLLSV